jgi:predicted Zn-dependent protease
MSNFFKTLVQMQGNVTERGLPSWFSTHPDPADRVTDVQKDAVNLQNKMGLTNLKINREEYLKKLPGLVYGDDPRQGYTMNSVFYHPELKFSFPVPAGWKINNSPAQVQIASADEKAAILFSLAAENTPQAAATQFVTKYQAQVQSQNEVKVNSLPAVKLITILAGQTQPLQVVSYFIAKDSKVYIFHGFTVQTEFNQYQSVLQTPMLGFSNLTDPARINVKPDRLQIKKVTASMTLQQALKANGVADQYLQEHALMNGMDLAGTVAAGTLIKLVERGK